MIPSTEWRGGGGGLGVGEGVLSGESLMCSQTVSLQICVHVCVCMGKKEVSSRRITILNYACLSLVRSGGGGDMATGMSHTLLSPGTNLDRKELGVEKSGPP